MAKKKMTAKAEKKEIKKIVFASLTPAELKDKAVGLVKEIDTARLQTKIGRLKNVKKTYQLKKQLARVLTALNAKIATDHENN